MLQPFPLVYQTTRFSEESSLYVHLLSIVAAAMATVKMGITIVAKESPGRQVASVIASITCAWDGTGGIISLNSVTFSLSQEMLKPWSLAMAR